MDAITLEQNTTTSTVPDSVERESTSVDIVPAPRMYVDHLTPPIGTSFFHKETIPIFDNRQIWGTARQQETLTWRTDVYKYATGARPDEPNFREKGGEIYIIMVHSGTGHVLHLAPMTEYVESVKAPPSVMPVRQYPASHSGTQSGDNWSYSIQYSHTMPMFNNGGSSVFDFDASYQEDFIRYRSEQTGIETTDGVEFGTTPRTFFPAMPPDYSIIGLSIFKCLEPSAFPVKFNFKASAGNSVTSTDYGSIQRDVSINFDFKP